MDYVDWCGRVFSTLLEITERSQDARLLGVRIEELAMALFGEESLPDFYGSTRRDGLLQAYKDLKAIRLIEVDKHRHLSVPRASRAFHGDPLPWWQAITSETLTDDERQLVEAVNHLTERPEMDHAWLEPVFYERIAEVLGLPEGYNDDGQPTLRRVVRLVKELHAAGFLGRSPHMTNSTAQATYKGLVWETRRRFTADSAEIDALILEGETPTVDFKRQLELGTPARNGELVKDVIALANTKASGPRYLLIGFTDDGDHYDPSDPGERQKRDRLLDELSQDRLQSIISDHTVPAVKVRYTEIAYRAGRVGKLEVLRDPTEVPYSVSKDVGRLKAGQVFHRHMAITREASPEEVIAMRADAERAVRRRAQSLS